VATFSGLRTGATHNFVVIKLEDFEITCKDAAGQPLANWWYLATLPDGTEKKGQLDANGHAKLQGVPQGDVNVKVTQDEPVAPPPPAPAPPSTPPATATPDPGSGEASDRRRETMSDRLQPFQPPDAPPASSPPPDENPPATPADSPPPASKGPLVAIATAACDEVEWEAVVMEITEGRHGDQSGACCPQNNQCGFPCKGFFYSWCGDFATWVYWKAGCQDGTLLNRAALNGTWVPQMNLTYIQNWGRARGLYHERDGFVPSPGDFMFTDHIPSWHVGIVERVEGDSIWTLNGKSFDTGWFQRPEMVAKIQGKGKCQGVARKQNSLSEIRAFVDTRDLRASLGYE
jgi:hypothetical protein